MQSISRCPGRAGPAALVVVTGLLSFAVTSCGSAGGSTDDSPSATGREGDPEMAAVLKELAELGPKPIESLEPDLARRQPTLADAMVQLLQKRDPAPERLPAVGRVESRAVPGPGGVELPVRVYSPKGQGPFPVIVYFHGGGWVLATLDTYDASCRALVDQARAVVVSVDYRRAPEHKFPAAHEDAYAAVQHVLANAKQFGGDPQRVAVAGESAGGNLATAACLLAKQRGGRMPVHQLLIYPVTDHALDTPSYREHAHGKPLNAAMMQWFFRHYLPAPEAGKDPWISPLRAPVEELRALPPATVILAELDPLRSEGQAYAERLASAGIDVAVRDYPGVTHEFFGLAAVLTRAREAQRFAAERLRASFQKL